MKTTTGPGHLQLSPDVRIINMKTLWATVLLVLFCGCSTFREEVQVTTQVRVGNRSPHDIRFVTINSDAPSGGLDMGFFGAPGPRTNACATASSCRLHLSKEFRIQWKEENRVVQASLDILKYRPVLRRIECFSFWYVGGGVWDVVAQEGAGTDSKVVLLSGH